MRELIIQKKYNNKDIYSVLKKEFPNLSLASLNKAFRIKDIKVNDIRVNKDHIVKENDNVKIYLNDNILLGLSKNIYYAYEDDNILIAYKPKGVISNHETGVKSTSTPYFDELVKQNKGENLKICHRLDTNTEGLIIFSKNETAHNEILNAFKNNNITKEYLALVYGKLPKSKDTLSHFILKDEKTGVSKIFQNNVSDSKTCITEYNLIKYIKAQDCSITSIKLHTGRTHQIRAHMKFIGCPVIGDSKYCTNEINNKFKIYSQVLFAVKYTFTFDDTSPLAYFNELTIDISNDVLNKINKLISKEK